MTAPKVYKTEAIVLRRLNVGEADKLLVLFTPTLGKVRAIARGARRPKSRLGGHLEVPCHCTLMLARGQNLDIVTQAQTIESFLPLRSDLRRSSQALYAAELVEQLTAEHGEGHAVYGLLLETLRRLCQDTNQELVMRHFELNLLTHLGYRPQLYSCLECRAALKPALNFFSPHLGGVLCPACGGCLPDARPISPNAVKAMRFMAESPYPQASRLRMGRELSEEIEGLLRRYILYLLEHEVKSVQFLDLLRREPIC